MPSGFLHKRNFGSESSGPVCGEDGIARTTKLKWSDLVASNFSFDTRTTVFEAFSVHWNVSWSSLTGKILIQSPRTFRLKL